MTSLAQDVRFSLRLLSRDRGFTAVTLSILALAIGTTTPTFSMLNAYLLRPLPFFEPERLVHLWATDTRQGWSQGRMSVPEFLDWRRAARSFESLAAFNYTAETLSGGDPPEEVSAGRVSANAFDVLGRRAAIGRAFRAGEDGPGAEEVVVLSDAFWRSRYEADPRVLGRTLEINGRAHTIVGVMPADFVFPLPTTRLWVPRVLDAGRHPREQSMLQVVGRLAAGVSQRQAQAEMTALAARLAEQYPRTNRDRGVDVADLRRSLNFGDQILRVMSVVLFVAHGFVLLIACSNVAALLLARAFGRAKELAVRAALGASRGRLVRQLLIENAALALAGGLLGALLAAALIRALSSVVPADLYRVGELSLDAPALAFTLGVSLLATLLSGLIPALRVSQVDLAQAFRDASAALSASHRALRLQSLLVVGQLGLAVVLLIGTGLMLRTFRAVQDVDPGFDPKNVLTLELKPSREAYPADEQVAAFHRRLIEEASRLPGVRAAATVNYLPLNHESHPVELLIPGAAAGGPPRTATLLHVSPGYFEVMRLPVRGGRVLEQADDLARPLIGVVNEALVRRYFGGRDAVGQTLSLEGIDRPLTIVGVVATAKHWDLVEPPTPHVYVSFYQRPGRYLRLLMRTEGDPLTLAVAARRAVAGVDAKLPVTAVRSMEQVVEEFLLPRASLSFSLAALGAGALSLAAIGVYGLMLFFVSRRTREIGLRLALGASRRDVLRLVLGRALRLVSVGVGIGLAGALALSKAMSGLLYGVGSVDVASFSLVPLLLATTAALAAWLPARRAARLDPSVTLRID